MLQAVAKADTLHSKTDIGQVQSPWKTLQQLKCALAQVLFKRQTSGHNLSRLCSERTMQWQSLLACSDE